MDRAHNLIAAIRGILIFGLGVALVVDAIVAATRRTDELIAGLVLLGLVPIDGLLSRRRER